MRATAVSADVSSNRLVGANHDEGVRTKYDALEIDSDLESQVNRSKKAIVSCVVGDRSHERCGHAIAPIVDAVGVFVVTDAHA